MQPFADVALTATERELLTFLLASPGRVFTRERLLAAISVTADGHRSGPAGAQPGGAQPGGAHAGPVHDLPGASGGPGRGGPGGRRRRGGRPAGPRAVDVYVAQLRAKLGDRSPIRTVRGVGYSAQPQRPQQGTD